MRNWLAFLGASMTALAMVPYIVDIFRGKTKPNIVTWLTWALLTGIATAAAFAAHEPKTAYMTLANTLGTITVVLLGIKYGIAKFSWFDGICQIGALTGLVLWYVFNSPSIAIIASVSIDLVGVLPTLKHSWVSPQEETWQSFIWNIVGPVFTIASLTRFNIASLSYPLYLFVADGAMGLVVIYRRKSLGISLSRSGTHETLRD